MAQRQFRNNDTAGWPYKFGNGASGIYTPISTIDTTPNTTLAATLGSTSATTGTGTGFNIGDLILIHQTRNGGTGVGNWELNKITSVGGGTNWTLDKATIYAYDTTAQVYLLKQYAGVNIAAGVTITGQSWDGTKGGIYALLCSGTATIAGNIKTDGVVGTTGPPPGIGIGFSGGLSMSGPTAGPAYTGEGSGGASVIQTTANGNGAGGSNATPSFGVAGGGSGGGNGTVGDTGQSLGGATVGTPGAAVGQVSLQTIFMGGGGGGCSGGLGGSGGGGGGGGIIFIFAKTLNVTGSITSNGGAGGQSASAGGSGAGGSILIKTQIGTLGTSLVTAPGGVKTTGTGLADGAAGGTGRIHLDYYTSFTGTTSPTIDSSQDSSLGTGAFVGIIG